MVGEKSQLVLSQNVDLRSESRAVNRTLRPMIGTSGGDQECRSIPGKGRLINLCVGSVYVAFSFVIVPSRYKFCSEA